MAKLIDIAMKEVGVVEAPKNSNKSKYGAWFGFDGVAWCGMFVSWCFFYAGIKLPKIGFSKQGFAGCQSAVSYFKKQGWIVPHTEIKEGDNVIVFYDWNGDGRFDHTGIFMKHNADGKTFTAIEGNTAIGNDSNGGQVMIRNDRKYSVSIFVKIPQIS